MDYNPPGTSALGFFSQEYWTGLPFPSSGDLPNPGIEPTSLESPALASGFFTTSATLSLSHVLLFVTPWIAAHQVSLSFTIS